MVMHIMADFFSERKREEKGESGVKERGKKRKERKEERTGIVWKAGASGYSGGPFDSAAV